MEKPVSLQLWPLTTVKIAQEQQTQRKTPKKSTHMWQNAANKEGLVKPLMQFMIKIHQLNLPLQRLISAFWNVVVELGLSRRPKDYMPISRRVRNVVTFAIGSSQCIQNVIASKMLYGSLTHKVGRTRWLGMPYCLLMSSWVA